MLNVGIQEARPFPDTKQALVQHLKELGGSDDLRHKTTNGGTNQPKLANILGFN